MELCYYMEMDTKKLFAYGEFYEFFEMYDEQDKKWVISPISFSSFLHDYWCSLVTREEALKITDGNLPERAYSDYKNLLKKLF